MTIVALNSAVGCNTASGALKIATTSEVRAMKASLTSLNNATPGSGTVLNQVTFAYNSFGQLVTDNQAHTSAVSGSTLKVSYGYDSGGSSSNEIRATTLTYPTTSLVRTNSYGSSGSSTDRLNRVLALTGSNLGNATYTYTYTGSGMVVKIVSPTVQLDLWGGTSGTFTGYDRFNRVIDQNWQSITGESPADIDRYQYGYDRNGNRLWKANVVSAAASVPLDELYTYDNLNRLVDMQRGTLNSGKTGITSGTGVFEQAWELDPTGNWSSFEQDSSGIGTYDLVQGRTANKVNEITAITNSAGSAWASVSYDPAENMITFPQPNSPTNGYTATYDAWNRLVSVTATGSTNTYTYDGRNYRITKTESGTTTDVYYSSNWQVLEEQSGSGLSAIKRRYTWGVRYVDELVARHQTSSSPATTYYALQDANFNVTALADTTTGAVQERYTYTPYGMRTILTGSWGSRSTSTYAWVVGHQGLFLDGTELWYNRFRQLHSLTGIFLSRDPIEIRGLSNLTRYVDNCPTGRIDPMGLLGKECTGREIPCRKPGVAGPTSNGCGSALWQKYVAALLVPDIGIFGSACDNHDICYSTCKPSNDTRSSKNDCDTNLKNDLIKACQSKYPGSDPYHKGQETACEGEANVIYEAVQGHGDDPFTSAQQAQCDCCEPKPCTQPTTKP